MGRCVKDLGVTCDGMGGVAREVGGVTREEMGGAT